MTEETAGSACCPDGDCPWEAMGHPEVCAPDAPAAANQESGPSNVPVVKGPSQDKSGRGPDAAPLRLDVSDVPSMETMRSRIYDPVLYPSFANQFGDLRADAIRLLDRIEDLENALSRIVEAVERQKPPYYSAGKILFLVANVARAALR